MKILPVVQGSIEWLEARLAIPTASEFDNLITPKGEIRTGETPKTYLARKLAEKWGGPILGFNTFATEQGKILEGEAIPSLVFDYDWKIDRVGLITTDDGRVGCSPDGLFQNGGGGLEVKCPEPQTHVKYLLNGMVPPEYVAQVQGGLYVSGLDQWRFVSYRRRFPTLIVTVYPDDKIQEAINLALEEFLERFDLCFQKLIEINQGPPPPRPSVLENDSVTP